MCSHLVTVFYVLANSMREVSTIFIFLCYLKTIQPRSARWKSTLTATSWPSFPVWEG